MMRLCVVALNPAIDAEWRVDDLLWEEKNIVHTQRRWPGGKGVNVARWLNLFRARSELLIPLGGPTGNEMLAGIRAHSLRTRVVKLRDETRVNVVVTTSANRQMRFNPPGPKIRPDEWRAILREAERSVTSGFSLILSGALPRGVPTDAYTRLIRIAHKHGQKAFLDCDGAALAAGVKARPFLVKPNLHELFLWAGAQLKSDRAICDAAANLSRVTNGWVLVSLGQEGGLLVNARENFAMRGTPPRVTALNTVGAGDALLAAVTTCVAHGVAPEEWLRAGIGAGTVATQQEAGRLPTRTLVRQITSRTRLRRLQAL